MSNKSIGIILALIVAAGFGVLYFLMNDNLKKRGNIIEYIPENTVSIVKVNDPGQLLNKIYTEKSKMWKSLKSSGLMYQFIKNFPDTDSLLSVTQSIKEALLDDPLFIVTAIDKQGKSHSLLVKQTGNILNPEKLYAYLTENFKNLQVDLIHNDMLRILFNEDTVYVRINDMILAASKEQKMLVKHLRNDAQQRKLANLKDYITNSTEKTDARLYINYPVFHNLLRSGLTPGGKKLINFFANLALNTITDVKFKNSEILFSGFTATDSSQYYLKKFNGQAPLPNKVMHIIPYNTILLINQCFSDFSRFSLKANYTDTYHMAEETGNEIALLNNAEKGDDFTQRTYAVIRLARGNQSMRVLEKIASSGGSKKEKTYGSYTLRKINDKDFLRNTYGDMFAGITGNWFAFVEGYAVFANTAESLENFIRLYNTGKTLDLNENFKKFSDDISSKSNMLVYLRPLPLLSFTNLFTTGELSKKLTSYRENMADIQGVVLQYSAGKAKMYTNFFLKYGKSTQEENLALWKVELDDNVYGKPSLVWDHRTKTYNTVVFDVMSNMYLINARGQIQWKKRIDGSPMSEIYEVDYYKNHKTQYLFNTRDFIYLIDRNGNFVQGYPIKLNPSATNGLSLFDYKQNKDYRLIIAQADKTVYNYTLKGKKVQGWKKPKTRDIVKDKVYRIVTNGKDYFIISDISDNVLVVNRRGDKRISLQGDLEKARYSAFYANKTNNKGIIITTDNKGRLVYISAKGKLTYTEFGKFSPTHFFLYGDFNGDGTYDFLFLDGKELKVFDRFKKVLFSYKFNTNIKEKPVIFDLGRKHKALGVVSSTEKTIYLFDQNGNTLISRGLVGETPFTVGSVNNDGDLNLITASENVIYNYRIQ